MSSFADQILTFNPHISQLPVEDMTKVGMIKQGQYDAGVEKVNQYKADIQSLDVIHPLQKEYIQSSLGNLNEQLKKVAGADFSNQQLVGQIGGMASKIANDPIVKNAVASTADIRRNQAIQAESQKNGNSSPSNEYVFQNSVNEFMNSGDVNSSYKGGYTPYNGKTRPKVFEAIKGLVPNEVIQDIARDPNFIGKDGKMHMGALLDAMKRHKVTSLDEGKIRTAIGAVLDANDYNQLSIDGQYYLQGHDVPQLGQTAINQYKNQVNNANTQLKDLQGQLSTTSDIQTQAELNSRIAYYKNLIGDHKKGVKGLLDQQLESDLVSIQNDPKSARGKLYTNNFIDEVSNAMAYRKVSDTIESSPEKENYWKTMAHDMQVATLNETKNQHAIENQFKQADQNLKEKEFSYKYGGSKGGDWTYEGNPTTSNLESMKMWGNYNADIETTNKGLIYKIKPPTSLKNSPADIAANAKFVLDKIENYKLGKPEGNPATPAEKRMMDEYISNEQQLKNNTLLYESKKTEAAKEILGGVSTKEAIKTDLSYHRPLVVNGVTYTPQEIYGFMAKEKDKTEQTQTGNAYSSYSIDRNSLSDKEKGLYDIIHNRYTGSKPTTGNAIVDAYFKDIQQIKDKHFLIESKVNALTAEKMKDFTGAFRPEQTSITFKTGEAEENFNKSLISVANADLTKGTAGIGYDATKAVEWLGQKKQGSIDITTVPLRAGDKYFIKVVNTKDPANPQIVPVTESWVRNNPALGEEFINKNLGLAQVFKMGSGSTNITGKPEDAYIKGGAFGSMDQYGRRSVTLPIIGSDFNKEDDGVYATIYIRQKDGGVLNYRVPYPVVPEIFQTRDLPGLTDESLLGMIRKSTPNIDQIIKK